MNPAKSDALHELHGTTPSSPAKVTECYVHSGRPKFPKGISSEQKVTFKRITSLLASRRTVTEADCEIIFQYAVLHDVWTQAHKEIRENGVICDYTRTSSNGEIYTSRKKNEAISIASDCSRQMTAILKELGLSPKSRSAVKPTTNNPAETIVPGSMAAMFGADLGGLAVVKKPLTMPAPIHFEPEQEPEPEDVLE
jgi:P27 family predicted phage terminase small subunit